MASHLLQVPAGPRSVQSHLEPEDKGGTPGRPWRRDACLRCGSRAWQWQRHLLEPPGVWGLFNCQISVLRLSVYQGSLKSSFVFMLMFAGEIWVPFRWDKDRRLLPASASGGGWKRRNKRHQEIVRLMLHPSSKCSKFILLHSNQSILLHFPDMSSSMNFTIVFC